MLEAELQFREKLKQRQRECVEKNLPEDKVLEILSLMVHDEEMSRPLGVGSVAPAFALTDQAIPRFSHDDLLAKGPAIVTFYRGLWCPYCREDLMCFQEALSEIQAMGASVVGISHNLKLDRGQGFLKPEDVSFPILDDSSGEIAVQFGIRWPVDELEIIREYLGTNLGAFRETDPWIVPMQARFVINTDRTVSFAEIAYNYDQRSSPVAVLPILRKLANVNN